MAAPSSRRCDAINESGRPCGATPLREEPYCFWHSPDHQQEAAEARRLGGQRRRREGTLEGAFALDELAGLALAERVLQIATIDALSLENSNQRSRTLIQASLALIKLQEVGDLQAQIDELHAILAPRQPRKARR